MGAPDKVFSRFIPKEQVGEAASWEFEPLAGEAAPTRGAEKLLLERERRAFERGRQQGRVEGRSAAQRDVQEQSRQVERVLAALRARFAELESAGADQVLDLAVEIARQVVRREVEVNREALLPALREAVHAVIDQHAHPRVHVHPQDQALLADSLDADGLFKGCRFIADASIERGGVRVETPYGEVDASLATRWRRVLEALGVAGQTTFGPGPASGSSWSSEPAAR